MPRDASELARRLARDAEAVCRHYLSNGRRQGRYWTVGDVRNTPGRSMFVRLSGPESGPGAAGHWTDAASAEYGDLLDVIRDPGGLVDFRDVADEARRFLSLPQPELRRAPTSVRTPVPAGSPEAAQRLFAMSQIDQRHAGRHLFAQPRHQGLARHGQFCDSIRAATIDLRATAPRPRLGQRWSPLSPISKGRITGAHRTWLAPRRPGKAPIDTPRRAMGGLLGHAVRFGAADDVLAVGEGIETMLSLRSALPAMPMAAALSANHLAAFLFPLTLRRLYVARDADAAGDMALAALTERAEAAGIEALALSPRMGDFNEDLRTFGLGALRAALRIQLAPQDDCFFCR